MWKIRESWKGGFRRMENERRMYRSVVYNRVINGLKPTPGYGWTLLLVVELMGRHVRITVMMRWCWREATNLVLGLARVVLDRCPRPRILGVLDVVYVVDVVWKSWQHFARLASNRKMIKPIHESPQYVVACLRGCNIIVESLRILY